MPYASIIIPTYDRHSTLPFVVRSLQAQTIPDIEIIISGDGCSPDVRAIAQSLSGADPRITFLDFPKAPMRGAINRDKAVRSAKSERIFYSDDDDVMLPHHIETLGRELNTADIVDTPVASVRLYGPPALGILNSSHPKQREMLQSEALKGVFDTHLAHTKQTYLERSGAWAEPPDRRVVLHMLKTFAADSKVRWKSVQRITALSVHGARRLNASASVRAAELAALSNQLGPKTEDRLRSEGGYCSYANALFKAVGPEAISNAAELFSTVGLSANVMSDRQLQSLSALIDVKRGRKPNLDHAAYAIHEMLEPLHAPFFRIADTVTPFITSLGPIEFANLLQRLPNDAPVLLARAHTYFRQGDLARAKSTGESAIACADETDSLAARFACAEDLVSFKQPDLAWALTNDMLSSIPHSFHMARFWRLRAKLANMRGAVGEHTEALLMMEALANLEV